MVEDYGRFDIGININDGTTSMSGGAKGGMVDLAKLTAGITAMTSITGEILGIVKDAVSSVLKPARTMLVGVLKLVAQLLRPITDMVVLLLMPILAFLRPIIKVFNDMMRPFRTAAYQLMKASTQTTDPVKKIGLANAASMSIMTGLGVGLIAIVGEILKFIIDMIIGLMGALLDVIGFNGDKFVTKTTALVNGWIDTGVGAIQSLALDGVKSMAEGLGVNLNNSIQSGINKAFSNLTIPEKFGQSSSTTSNTMTQNQLRAIGNATAFNPTGVGVSFADQTGGYSMRDFPKSTTPIPSNPLIQSNGVYKVY